MQKKYNELPIIALTPFGFLKKYVIPLTSVSKMEFSQDSFFNVILID